MPGFHPLLGLLAVAVCISYVKGAAFSSVVKDRAPTIKIQESNAHRPLIAENYNDAQERSLNKDNKHKRLREDKHSQHKAVIAGTKFADNNQGSSFGLVANLRAPGENALSRRDATADSRSGDIDDASNGDSGLMTATEPKSELSQSSSAEESQSKTSNESNSEGDDLGSAISKSEESCEEVEETKPTDETPTSTASTARTTSTTSTTSTISTTSTTTSSPTIETTGTTDECEDSSSESSSSDSQGSSNETVATESEECEETETPAYTAPKPTTTSSTKRSRRPDVDGSSGSFGDTDEDGVIFSDSNSDESNGTSTELTWKR